MRNTLAVAYMLLGLFSIFPQSRKLDYGGTVYMSTITADRVNLRSLPSLKGKVITQLNAGAPVMVIGISETPQTIGSHSGYWLRVKYSREKEQKPDIFGWIYSQYIKGLSDQNPATFTVKSFEPEHDGQPAVLSLQISRDNKIADVIVYLYRYKNQSFYTYTWSFNDDLFHHSDIPGTYIWYPEKFQLQHATYEGYSLESAWTILTDDLEYVLQDFGTGPGIRAVGVWRRDTGEEIYSGSYCNDINLSGHEIDIAYSYDRWSIDQGLVDIETEAHVKEYVKNNPQPNFAVPIAFYRLNLDTGKRTFKGCRYITEE